MVTDKWLDQVVKACIEEPKLLSVSALLAEDGVLPRALVQCSGCGATFGVNCHNIREDAPSQWRQEGCLS